MVLERVRGRRGRRHGGRVSVGQPMWPWLLGAPPGQASFQLIAPADSGDLGDRLSLAGAKNEPERVVAPAVPDDGQSAKASLPSWADASVLRYGDLALDPRTREVRRGARDVELTRREFDLLALFIRHPRMVMTRELIFDRVWGYGFGTTSNTLNVHIGSLRRKLESGGEPRLIQTVHGVGYVLRQSPPVA
jgi:DNA-binding response OmpR family regulator